MLFRIWLLDDKTKTKRPVVEGHKSIFTKEEKDKVIRMMLKKGYALEIEPFKEEVDG